MRREARARHAVACAASGLPRAPSTAALLDAADRLTGFSRVGLERGDSLLDGGDAVLDREAGIIWYRRDAPPRLAAFYQAHEYAHLWLHDARSVERACREGEVDGEAALEPVPSGARRVEGYGPHERREREANVFARELLLPADSLRWLWLEEGLDPHAIAARVGLAEGLVRRALVDALLLPEPSADAAAVGGSAEAAAAERQPAAGLGGMTALGPADAAAAANPRADLDLELDPSQRAAAHAPRGPLLVEAGPGTGKTRTLVARAAYLLRERAVAPERILALTFSNRAAEEMRERLARVVPAAAPRLWMGTFHAFGLEVLRKYGTRIGLPPRPSVLDQMGALSLLERLLPDLALDHYANLYEPTLHLGSLLAAISRAKDEVKGPPEYRALAEAMAAAAVDEAEHTAAARALEVAGVYAVYQAALEAAGLLDFGDLVARAVRLLEDDADAAAALRVQYQHILVDEYQDVNRASGRLLRALAAGGGAGVWVVGDARQAIYRFRGAAPSNMRLFSRDFPDAQVLELRRNYRARPAIVRTVAAMARTMPSIHADRPSFAAWEPSRADDGSVVPLHVAADDAAEGDGIAREVERQRAAGIAYRDQAILCRSHAALARVAARLERAGIPLLYLGDVFERPEVRDLLALVALACEPDGRGLVRVAAFPEYAVPLADVRALLAHARQVERPFPDALSLADQAPGLSVQGRAGLARLRQHLDDLCDPGTDPWTFLSRYLLERGRQVLRDLLADTSVAGVQRRLALYQALQVAQDLPSASAGADGPADPKARLLRHVRQLEIVGEEQALRQVPGWAGALDAVRLLTVHASKGLEFRAVYLPALAGGIFPASPRWQPCPPPPGLVERAEGEPTAEAEVHAAEEACLFFVALSRARDALCLSWARRYGRVSRRPSSLLGALAGHLAQPPDGSVTWPGEADQAPADHPSRLPPPSGPKPTYTAEMLDLYRACARRFAYEYLLGLGGKREDAAYVQLHVCVYGVLGWLREERAAGRAPDEAAAQVRLDELWAEAGPRDHHLEAEYLRAARGMVARAVTHATRARGRLVQPTWVVDLPLGRVRVRPDQVEEAEDGSVVVRRLRTGRPSESEQKKDVYGLYHAAAERAYADRPWRLEVVYLGHDVVQPVSLTAGSVATRLTHYEEAIAGILRGAFAPNPSDRDCPRCPHYFICPTGDGFR